MTTLLRFTSPFKGKLAGKDRGGNKYYESTGKKDSFGRPVRWVLYAGATDPTTVPPEWWGWIHYTTAAPLPEDAPRKPWQKEHRPNLTGTAESYRPSGHDYQGGKRAPASGDYEAWTPESPASR